MWKTNVSIQKVHQHKLKKQKDIILMDTTQSIRIDNGKEISLQTSPRQLKALGLGYAYVQGVFLSSEQDLLQKEGCFFIDSSKHCETQTLLACDVDCLNTDQIYAIMEAFQNVSQLYRETGISKTVALCYPDEDPVFAEDICLESAFYKVIGECVLGSKQCPPIMVVSDAILPNLLKQAHEIGVKVLISRSGISYLAYQEALKLDITSIGFCRGQTFSVYTGFDRFSDPK